MTLHIDDLFATLEAEATFTVFTDDKIACAQFYVGFLTVWIRTCFDAVDDN